VATMEVERWASDPRFRACSFGEKPVLSLVFYNFGLYDQHLETGIRKMIKEQEMNRCFKNIIILFGNVSDVSMEHRRLFEIVLDPSNSFKPDYIFFMGHQTFPIRPNWARKIFAEAVCGDDFWIMGSQHYLQPSRDYLGNLIQYVNWHVNSNALFNTHDQTWLKTVQNITSVKGHSFDWLLYKYFYDIDGNFSTIENSREKIQYYRYSDFVVNRGSSHGYPRSFYLRNPNTYFVHGGGIIDEQ